MKQAYFEITPQGTIVGVVPSGKTMELYARNGERGTIINTINGKRDDYHRVDE